MKLLLTSGGVTNASIREALVGLLGKPIAESDALCIPTALWGYPRPAPIAATDLLSGRAWGGTTALGWTSTGVLELSTLPTIGADQWVPWVHQVDVLLVAGGEATYLCHWLRESGLAEVLPTLEDTVWVGVSAGSLALTPRIGDGFVEWPGAVDDRALGLVDFSIFPHLDVFPENTLQGAERWAFGIGGPAYAIDDQTAIKVDGDSVEVVSEGQWKLLP